jgi:nickel-dependent lactate racemase
MRINFPYPEIKPLEVPDQNLLGIFAPSIVEIEKSEDQIIEEALLQPIGSSPLPEITEWCQDVLVLVDDYTRPTPTQKILPRLIKKLEQGGIKREGIRFLIASGTHRSMTEEEILRKFGEEIPKQYLIQNHHWWDSSQMVYLGETSSGIPIHINRLVEEVDLVIGIGQIVPHRVSGFSGGGNIIQPGICGEETTGKTHWLSAQFDGWEILGRITNPVKKEIERVAEKAGLEWIINTIQDGTGRLVGVVAGDPVHAYREGAAKSREVYQSLLPEEADIVITDSHPYDSELWLAAKGIYAAELAVKKGGIVILITPCPEGISVSHPEILEWGYQTFEEVEQEVRQGKIKKLTAAAHLVHVGRVIKERAKGILVSPGISKEEAERLGFIYARNPQEALDIAFSHLSRDAKVAVLQRGGEILPVIKDSAS